MVGEVLAGSTQMASVISESHNMSDVITLIGDELSAEQRSEILDEQEHER